MVAPGSDVTTLLRAWSEGDRSALDRLAPLVYAQLRRLASGYMRAENRDHLLQTTALVHEALVRLLQARGIVFRDRDHYMATASRIMRRILVDYARGRAALKRGGGNGADVHATLEDVSEPAVERAASLCALDDALETFAQLDPRRAQVVELRFFGGFSVEEIAKLLGVSEHTVIRDWGVARAWLARELSGPQA